MMRSCPTCEGFVPGSVQTCPHCDRRLSAPQRTSLAARIGVGLLIGSTSMTLMACYGGPMGECDYREANEEVCGFGSSWSETSESDSWTEEGGNDTGPPLDLGGGEDPEGETEGESDTEGEGDSGDEEGMESCEVTSEPELIEASELPVGLTDVLECGLGTSHGSCGGAGAERVYAWTPPSSGTYEVSVATDAELVLYARIPNPHLGGSCGYELGCATSSTGGTGPRLRLELHEGRTVLLIVDGAAPDEGGAYELRIEASP